MKNTKRFLAVLLVLVMVLSCLPMTALAAGNAPIRNVSERKATRAGGNTGTLTNTVANGDEVYLYNAANGVVTSQYAYYEEDEDGYFTYFYQACEDATVSGQTLTTNADADSLIVVKNSNGTYSFYSKPNYDDYGDKYYLYADYEWYYAGMIGEEGDEDSIEFTLEPVSGGYMLKEMYDEMYLTIVADEYGDIYLDLAEEADANCIFSFYKKGGSTPVDPTDPTEPIETDPIETEPVDPADDEVITATWTQMPENGDAVVLYSAKDGAIMAYSAESADDGEYITAWNQNTEPATVEGTKLTAAWYDAGILYALDMGDGIWAFVDEYEYDYNDAMYCLYNDGTFAGTIGDPENDGDYVYYELEMTTSGCLFKNVGSGLYLTIGSDGLFYDTENASEATPLAFYVVDGVDPIEPIDPGEDEYITAAWTKLPENGDPVVLYSAKNGVIMAWSFEGEEDEEGYYTSWNQYTEEVTLDGYTLTAAYDDAGVFYAVDNGDGTWTFVDQFYYDYFELESCLYNDGEFVGTCGDPEYDGDYVCYELEAAADGYLFKNVGSGLYLTIGSDGLFYDTADASKATPLAFYVVGGEEPVEPTDPCEGYTDIDRSAWYHDAADFVLERGIMGSTKTDAKTFEPYTVCTRSMIATMLYSLEGKPAVSFEAKFPDVKQGQWFTDAVMWAYKNGVVTGYDNGNFGPNDKVTREQMAVILKAYAEKVKGIDTSKTADLSKFADAAKVTWSKPYITWAVAEGLLSGKAVGDKLNLDPQGNATRAEVAAIMRSFITNIIEAAK